MALISIFLRQNWSTRKIWFCWLNLNFILLSKALSQNSTICNTITHMILQGRFAPELPWSNLDNPPNHLLVSESESNELNSEITQVKLTGHTELKSTGQPLVNEQLSWKPFACYIFKVKKLLIVTSSSLLAKAKKTKKLYYSQNSMLHSSPRNLRHSLIKKEEWITAFIIFNEVFWITGIIKILSQFVNVSYSSSMSSLRTYFLLVFDMLTWRLRACSTLCATLNFLLPFHVLFQIQKIHASTHTTIILHCLRNGMHLNN